ncbi:MAG TPA: histidine kinase [Gemmatimonadales bacterium]|nr:histidine kinase [Gemmatimonadales bacterium]
MTERRGPGTGLGPLLLVLASVPILASAEAGLEYIKTLQGESLNTFSWMFRRFLLPWAELAACVPLALLLARRFPLEGAHRVRAVGIHVLGGIGFGTLHLFFDVLLVKLWWEAPLGILHATALMISWYLLRDIFIYWTIVGAAQLVRTQRALHRRELSEARLRADLVAARLAALQARLEPHFLFNTLNTAVMMVRADQRDQAVEVLLELSELLRAVVRGAPGHEVPLRDEWAFITRYLALEEARFHDRLTIELACEPDLSESRVPFLILQPLVENALRHGVARKSGPGRIVVTGARAGAMLRLSVQDDGPGPSATTDQTGIGIANVRARLRELYGELGRLELGFAPGGGALAIVTLPLALPDASGRG